MGVASLFFSFFGLVLGLWLFFVGWLVLGFLDFRGLGVWIKFALGRDDIQIRRNVYFMVFWYAVLQFPVSDHG